MEGYISILTRRYVLVPHHVLTQVPHPTRPRNSSLIVTRTGELYSHVEEDTYEGTHTWNRVRTVGSMLVRETLCAHFGSKAGAGGRAYVRYRLRSMPSCGMGQQKLDNLEMPASSCLV